MKDRKKDRGFYKPKSYRFSEKTHKNLKEISKKSGSQEKAMQCLIKLYKKHGFL